MKRLAEAAAVAATMAAETTAVATNFMTDQI